MTLLAFCQTALRLGSSRGLAYAQWRRYHDCGREAFERAWRAARAAERLFPLQTEVEDAGVA